MPDLVFEASGLGMLTQLASDKKKKTWTRWYLAV